MKTLGVGLLLALCAITFTPGEARAQTTPTCTSPWTFDHDYHAPFAVGKFYRNPYNAVIEVLADVCTQYETPLPDDNGVQGASVCVQRALAVRNRLGRWIVSTTKKMAMYFDGKQLNYADGYIPVDTERQAFGELPDGCFVPSTSVSVTGPGKVTFSAAPTLQ